MTGKISNMKELERSIAVLEETRQIQWFEIKATAEALSESVRPKNLVRQVVDEVVGERDVFKILQYVASIASGWLVHKVTIGKKGGLLMQILGRVGQFSITSIMNRVIRKFIPY